MTELEITLTKKNQELTAELASVKFQLAELKRMIFGAKSERFVPQDPNQLTLFDLAPVEAPEPEKQIIERNKPQSKKKPVRAPIPSHLPRVETIIEPEGIDLSTAQKIGEEITEFLNYKPSTIYVERIIRPKYKINNERIIIAELKNAQPIAKSNAGAALLAFILVSKYIDHLPLYRIVQMLKRQNVDISESTINGWVQMAMKTLDVLFKHLNKKIMASDYLMADETPIPVLESLKPGSTHKGYYWVYHSPRDGLISFMYHKSRSGEAVKEHLKDFRGYLQTDGYAGYDQFKGNPNITLLACMAHARRKFYAAQDNDKEKALHAMGLIGLLYDIEREARDQNMNEQQRHALRQQKVPSILKQLETWLKQTQLKVLPKSPIGEAINYTLKMWPRLIRYAEDGKLEIDNNFVENKIRPIALGRKNYLFVGNHGAAYLAGMIYSFMAMCKVEGVNPLDWLTYVLQNINNHSIQNLDELMPANFKLKQTQI